MVDVDKVRNIMIAGQAGAGKTSLAEALLFNAKATTRMGKVEDGNTVSDYEPEEVKRAGSIQTSLLPCDWRDHKINFLDTPGYDDFVGEVISAFRVSEGAVIAVAANAGVEVGTERAWSRCEESGLARVLFVSKMDRENADFARSVESVESAFGRKCVPFQVPIGSEQSFRGVVDLLNLPADVPGEVSDQVTEARERLIEAVAESDDELANKYLEGEDITQEELIRAAKSAILSGNLVPILAGSAVMNLGVEELLNAAVEYLPSPVEGRQATAEAKGEAVELKPEASAPLAAFVFKTTADPFVGKLSIFRVYQGTLRSNTEVWNGARGPVGTHRPGIPTPWQEPGAGPGDRSRGHRGSIQTNGNGHR